MSGTVNLFSKSSTAALTATEFEEGVLEDFKSALFKNCSKRDHLSA
ncbi:MAG: YjbQ family protein [Methanomicrobium sp.]|nr:YjbQ family protein [Methanomicrobium sp.]MDD4300015.1 YjbQ family protein [Methanomicrobium sp.]